MKTVYNSAPGVQTVVALEDGALITGTVQDCTAIADDAKRRHNAGNHGSSEMRHVARVPFVFVDKYCQDNNISMQELNRSRAHLSRMLSDPALAHFRIWKGQI